MTLATVVYVAELVLTNQRLRTDNEKLKRQVADRQKRPCPSCGARAGGEQE